MAGKSKAAMIEKQHGKPLKTVLIEAHEKFGSITAIAHELGVSQGTVSLWFALNGLKVIRVTKRLPESEIAS